MRLRNKLAGKYFLGAVLCFAVGYGAAWVDATGAGRPADNKPKAAASATPEATQAQIDQADTKKPTPKAGTPYTVKSGDTLSSIAEAHGTTFEKLAQYNDIPYPYNLVIGQVIVIPAS